MRLQSRLLALVSAATLTGCAGGADARSDSARKPAAEATPPAAADSSDPRVKRADLARITGESSASIWLVILSDFECPYCKEWHDETYPAIRRKYVEPGKVRVAYVNFPMPMHPNAVPAAEAAMCAGAQDRFWAYHDSLFGAQNEWASMPNPQPVFDRLGAALQLDSASFSECRRNHVMLPMIQADRRRGDAAAVNGTPTFLVGGRKIVGAAPFSEFQKTLDAVLSEAARKGR
jgi:protein-disulfide isomerase